MAIEHLAAAADDNCKLDAATKLPRAAASLTWWHVTLDMPMSSPPAAVHGVISARG